MSNLEKKDDDNDDSDDLLDKAFEMQDRIHPRCRISDNHEERIKRWNEKYKKNK